MLALLPLHAVLQKSAKVSFQDAVAARRRGEHVRSSAGLRRGTFLALEFLRSVQKSYSASSGAVDVTLLASARAFAGKVAGSGYSGL